MLDRLWKMIVGYVRIQADGLSLERLIGEANRSGIPLTSLRRLSQIRVTFSVSPRQEKRLMALAEQQRVSVTVLSRHGLHALLRRTAGRGVLIAASVLLCLAATASTQLVWRVGVVGGSAEAQAQVMALLETQGVHVGMLWHRVDETGLTYQIEHQLGDSVQKALVHKRGTALEIEIIPWNEPLIPQRGTEPCDLIAVADGVIDSIVATQGTAVVQKGETVKTGDVLIRGLYVRNIDEGKQRLTHATGTIMARVWVTGTAEVDRDVPVPVRTGEVFVQRTLMMFGQDFALTGEVPFEHYLVSAPTVTSLVGWVVPARILSLTFERVEENTVREAYEDTQARGATFALAEAQSKLPEGTEVLETIVTSRQLSEGRMEVKVSLCVLVSIGTERYETDKEPLLYIPKYW